MCYPGGYTDCSTPRHGQGLTDMTKRLVALMLIGIATAPRVSAQTFDPLNGLGRDRRDLSPQQVETRSGQLEISTTFSLLRHPDALKAPARIFKAEIWQAIERAARANDLDPMVLAGMIFVESYGDPLAKSPTGPAGIAQLTRSSARELGLSVGRRVRVGSRAVSQTSFVGKGKNRRRVVRTVRQPVYKTIDERYVPERAIGAMARRLSSRRAWLGGKLDFAIAEYHMGAGRMARLVSSYLGRPVNVARVRDEMAGAEVSYATLYWTNTPYFRPAVYSQLENLNGVDFSPTYYFRVRRAAQLLQMYRQTPQEYARLAARLQGGAGQPVYPSLQWSFLNDAGSAPVRSAYEARLELGDRFVRLPEIASAAGIRGRSGAIGSPALLAAERSTIGVALFIARQLRLLQGGGYTGFEIERMLSHDAEDEAAQRVHGLGWAFDIPTTSMSPATRRDLRFILTDLRQAGLLAYTEDGRSSTFHVVRHPDHAELFEQFYRDMVGGTVDTDVSSGVG